jgi:hypothetical protein
VLPHSLTAQQNGFAATDIPEDKYKDGSGLSQKSIFILGKPMPSLKSDKGGRFTSRFIATMTGTPFTGKLRKTTA